MESKQITKEEALYVLSYLANCEDVNTHHKEALEIGIEALEQQKTGKWKTTTTIFCGRTFEVIECSCCKQKQEFYARTKFCPNCGAKMIKPQESEDKHA